MEEESDSWSGIAGIHTLHNHLAMVTILNGTRAVFDEIMRYSSRYILSFRLQSFVSAIS